MDKTNIFAYAAILGTGCIMQMNFDKETGIFSPNMPPTVQTRLKAGPRHLTFHPNDKYVYLLNQTDATINTYRVEPGVGVLQEIEMITTLPPHFLGEANAADIHVTPDGRFLYASERQTSTLIGFSIHPKTALLSPIGRWPTETTPRGFAIDPRGLFLLSVGLDSNALSVYEINQSTGELSLRYQYAVGRMPNWVEIIDI